MWALMLPVSGPPVYAGLRPDPAMARFWGVIETGVLLYHNYVTVDASFFKVNPYSGVPIYLQLVEQLRHAIESCVLTPGEQLPTIRMLAQQLVVSPNTIVRVYTELDREGVIELRQGLGAFVADCERHRDRSREVKAAKSLVRVFVGKLRQRGFDDGEIRRFVEAELQTEAEEVHGH